MVDNATIRFSEWVHGGQFDRKLKVSEKDMVLFVQVGLVIYMQC